MTQAGTASTTARTLVLPLALAQFVASFAASNLNVAISAIAKDLDTSVSGLQVTITLFTLTMAALMVPGSKLTDIWGRKRCFVIGLVVYGVGAVLAMVAQGLGLLIVGYSLLQGVGSALLIPPVYILVTVAFDDLTERARYFGLISAAAGLGAAAGPLIGGLITSAISWRASFALQILGVVAIIVLARRFADIPRHGPVPVFDVEGAVLSAVGLVFVVLGVVQSSTYGWFVSQQDFEIGDTVLIPKGSISPVWIFVAIGALFLLWFVLHLRSRERAGQEPLLHLRLFRNVTSNLGLSTQLAQWLLLQGSFFVVSVFMQEVRGYSAIQTGLMLTPSTAGILVTASFAQRMAQRRPQRLLVIAGFATTLVGLGLVLALTREQSSVLSSVPGLFLVGAGIGVMLTSSVNVVQSAFPEADQGDISGVSRSVSNLGSSLGVALAGSMLVIAAVPGFNPFALSLITMIVVGVLGLLAAFLIPHQDAAAPAKSGAA